MRTMKIIFPIDVCYVKRYKQTMSDKTHPLRKYLAVEGETISSFAKRSKISRMHIYRIMNGENATIDCLRKLSKATKNEVAVSDFILTEEATQ